jgi:hypothetical protein
LNHFLQIAAGIDVMPLLLAVQRQPELWNQHRLRTTHAGSPHTEVDDIWLRFNPMPPPGEEARVMDEHESIWYPAAHSLTQCRPLIFWLMSRTEAERLGRCLVTRLRPGAKISPHVDSGEHAAYYERFHIVLQSRPGSLFRCGNDRVQMMPGDVWWFNNAVEHEVTNDSDDDRVHLIVDLRCAMKVAA